MKKKKLLTLVPIFLTISLFLSGCVQRTKSGKPYGIIYDHLAIPTQHIIDWLSNLLGGNGNSYGWAIIAITFIVRLVLMPVMLSQSKKATIQQEKMSSIRPQLAKIQKRQKEAQTQEEKAAVSQDMMALYKQNNISMTGGIGCLPLLIQMPIFAALYAAIQYSDLLSKSSFYGINLGHRSFTFVVLTFLIYALQGWLSLQGIPEEQKKQMSSMMIASPVMLAVMTYIAPAGLGLYFFVGGIFACLQTLLINRMRPQIKKRIEKEMKKNPPKEITPTVPTNKKATITSTSNEHAKKMHANNRKRNSGKQKRN
ncbi:membrane protein insertase YidC [Ligilactobacillus sp. WILCCON 0076]|uniref:Membrane protein insertase YidC n=1 Tax=Ligilactobacillus ubinensis TaxID=2876789 RepID=A0A9X2JLC0_9LACO|nr:membrane protein insertase YidC [Ligilactobacillus ubinensis]MCP0886440.1 membrane protein insertase YidC [Ligilactobacillus ubinensis]